MEKLPADLAREVFKKGQGNPFLTEKIVTALRDSGALKIRGKIKKEREERG